MADLREVAYKISYEANDKKLLKSLNSIDKKTDKASGRAATLNNKLLELHKSSRKTSSSLSKFAKTAVAAFSVKKIMDFGKTSIITFSNFQQQMARVHAITGANKNDFETLTKTARKLGKETIFSAEEIAKGMEYAGMAGWKTTQIVAGMPAILDLAVASGEDLGVVSDIVTDALTAFNMKATDATRFSDVLAATATSANTDVSKMGETFKYVAPVAGSLGYSLEDTALAIAIMGNNSIKSSQAGTTLRRAMLNMVKPASDKAAASMDNLGISIKDSNGKVKSLNKLLPDIRKGFSKLTKAQKAEYAATIFGSEASAGMLSIINTSEEEYNKLSDAINNSSGAAKKMADIQGDTLTGSFKSLQSVMSDAMIDLGESLAPKIREFSEFLKNELIPRFVSISDKIGKLYNTYFPDLANALGITQGEASDLVTGGLDLINNGLQWFIDNKSSVESALLALGIAYGVYRGVLLLATIAQLAHNFATGIGIIKEGLLTAGIVGLYIAQGIATAATWLMVTAQEALNLVMSLNPLTKVIALVLLLVTAFIECYNNSENFRIAVGKLWWDLKRGAENTINWFIDQLNFLISKVNEFIDLINKIPLVNIGKMGEIQKVDFTEEARPSKEGTSLQKSGGGITGGISKKGPGGKSKLFNTKAYATGTFNTPDNFIAGENGPELITGLPNRKVYNNSNTEKIFNNDNSKGNMINNISITVNGDSNSSGKIKDELESFFSDLSVKFGY